MKPHESEANETEALDQEYTLGTWTRQRDFEPTEVVDTDGPRIVTADGDSLLDFSSQYVCTSLGYDAERVADAVADQIRDVPYVNPGWSTEPRAKLSEKLAEITPGSLKKTFYSTSGTEANEVAFKIARAYTGNHKILSRYRSYHGATAASLSASGDPRRVAQGPEIQPEVPGMVKGPDPYAYGSSLDPEKSLEYIDEMLKLEGGTVAGVLVEPLVGSNGVLTPPDDYLPRLQEIAHDHGALLIVDEVQSGYGRTGELWASDHFDVVPDIMPQAKGIANGLPLGAFTARAEVADAFESGDHLSTFGGNPVACAAALATIEELQDGIVDDTRDRGAWLSDRLADLEAYDVVGETRGLGLMQGVELIDPAETGPMDVAPAPDPKLAKHIGHHLRETGIVIGVGGFHSNVLRFQPPLTIPRDDLERTVTAIEDALDDWDGH